MSTTIADSKVLAYYPILTNRQEQLLRFHHQEAQRPTVINRARSQQQQQVHQKINQLLSRNRTSFYRVRDAKARTPSSVTTTTTTWASRVTSAGTVRGTGQLVDPWETSPLAQAAARTEGGLLQTITCRSRLMIMRTTITRERSSVSVLQSLPS